MKKIHTEAALSAMSSKELVELYNEYSAKPVKKFADKTTAVKRVYEVLPVAPKSEAPAEGSGKVAALHARVITLLVKDNPKRGESAERYSLYKSGMTVGKYLELGGYSKDIGWDVAHGFISAE